LRRIAVLVAIAGTVAAQGNGNASVPVAAATTEASQCEQCAKASDRTSPNSPCWYASAASSSEYVQHRFCSAQASGSGMVYACCPVKAKGLSWDCSETFGRCSCVGNGCAPQQNVYQDTRNYGGGGPSLLGTLIPLLLICSIISCCISYRRQQQAMYYGQELSAMPPNFHGGHPNAPGYGQQGAYPMAQTMGQPMYGQPMYGQNQGMSAGTGAALGATGGFLGGMMLANAMDGGHDQGGYGGGGAPQQDMGGGGQDMGADMGFGE